MTSGVPDDVPQHWDITFSVDDADAIADKTAELGGKVLVPPFDAGVVRTASLSDPQGAVFAVKSFSRARSRLAGNLAKRGRSVTG